MKQVIRYSVIYMGILLFINDDGEDNPNYSLWADEATVKSGVMTAPVKVTGINISVGWKGCV